MGHGDNGHNESSRQLQLKSKDSRNHDFVLEKGIFSNIFERDIRRVFIYKKAERLAKAIHLIAPAFIETASLRNRMDGIAIGLVDAAILPPGLARTALSRELLALSSILSIARTGGLLSSMNADLIAREAHILLQEVAEYEEPRLFLDDAPTLSGIARSAHKNEREFAPADAQRPARRASSAPRATGSNAKREAVRHVKDIKDAHVKDRREAVMSVIRNKGKASIKDISTIIRDVSEKTIQRELQALVEEGSVVREGERRWSTYSLA